MLDAKICAQAEHDLLQALKQTADSKWYRRLKMIHLSAHGHSVSELAMLFDCCAATVRDYITRYNAGGLKGLKPDVSDGAPVQIPLTKAEWEDLLHQSPAQFDKLKTAARNWSQNLLVAYLAAYHEVSVTRQAVSAVLKRHDVRLNRGKLTVTSPDPLYRVKRCRLDEFKKKRKTAR